MRKRKVATKSDIFYIENHLDMSVDEISEEIGLVESEVEKHKSAQPKRKPIKKVAKKELKLGRSKVKLKHGNVVYQFTEDIDAKPSKPQNTPDQDEKAGIYRG